jgi:hypothetical protein
LRTHRVNTLLHLNQLLTVIDKDVQTNLTPQEQLAIAFSMRNLTPSSMLEAQVAYTSEVDLPGYGRSIVADERAKHELVTIMLMDRRDASGAAAP